MANELVIQFFGFITILNDVNKGDMVEILLVVSVNRQKELSSTLTNCRMRRPFMGLPLF